LRAIDNNLSVAAKGNLIHPFVSPDATVAKRRLETVEYDSQDAESIRAQLQALKAENAELVSVRRDLEKENVRLVFEETNFGNKLITYQENIDSMERTIANRDDTINNLRLSLSNAEEKNHVLERDIKDRDCTIDDLRNSLDKANDKLTEALTECDDLSYDLDRALERGSRYKSERDSNYRKVEKLEEKLVDREDYIADQRGMIRTYHEFLGERNVRQKTENTEKTGGCSLM
jgi:chromosome segregation ATPase